MGRIETDIRRLGGIAKAGELARAGHSPDRIYAAVLAGRILRVRKGWYANVDLAPDAVRAFRVGGRMTCASGAAHHGLWVPDYSGLHLAVPRRASRLRTADDFRMRLSDHPDDEVIVHWGRRDPSGSRQVVGLLECIPQAFACRGPEFGFIVLESALRKGRLDAIDRRTVLDALRVPDRELARRASSASDSGTESMVRLRLMALGIGHVQQARLGGVGPVDFLIGDSLVIEVDSREHHSDPYRDRRKDAELSIRGYRVLRFMYSQIVYEWPVVEASILAALSRGDHRPA